MLIEGKGAEEIIKNSGLEKISDRKIISELAEKIINLFPNQANEYRNGKLPLMAFFLGKLMAETGGKADPTIAKECLEEKLK